MRDKGIGVGGFDHLGGVLEGAVDVAVFAQGVGGGVLRNLLGALREFGAALGGAGDLVPDNLELLARGLGLPPGIGNDRDAGFERDFEAEDYAVGDVALH